MDIDQKKEKTERYAREVKELIAENEKRNAQIGKFYRTVGFKKLWHYLLRLIETEKFQKEIVTLRAICKISPKGYVIADPTTSWTHPPKEWRADLKTGIERTRELWRIRKNIVAFCLSHNLPQRGFTDVIESYLFYNRPLIALQSNAHNLCYAVDIKERRNLTNVPVYDEDIEAYPIAILISPDASLRAIKDYIDAAFSSTIKPLQARYKNPASRVNSVKRDNADVRKKYDLIYKNRHLKTKEIRDIVWKELHIRVLGKDIRKIIALEGKRRKEV